SAWSATKRRLRLEIRRISDLAGAGRALDARFDSIVRFFHLRWVKGRRPLYCVCKMTTNLRGTIVALLNSSWRLSSQGRVRIMKTMTNGLIKLAVAFAGLMLA